MIAAAALSAVALVAATSALAQDKPALRPVTANSHVKMNELDLGTLETGRPSRISVWYPEGACAQPQAKLCLAEDANTNKVVVFSHGSMGSAREYAWVGESLAAAGFVVVGLNHFGESSLYGEDTRDPRNVGFAWQRAQDLSAVLTRLAGRNPFQRDLDWNNVVAIGHSAGGQTAAAVGGAKFDLRQLAAYCGGEGAKADLSCNYGRNRGNAPASFIDLFNASYQDTRVKKLVLLDPALGSALQQQSLSSITLPTLVVGAVQTDFLPWENHGARYAAGIPGVRTILLNSGEGHFVFLSPCHHQTKVMGIPLCEDRPGVDRVAVQRSLAPQIVDFVSRNDEPKAVARLEGVKQQATTRYPPRNAFLQVLFFTPKWVFALLVGLIIFGLMQVRTRPVRVWLALTLPVAMLALSLSGVVQYVGLWIPALGSWVLGAGAVAALLLKRKDPKPAIYDTASRRLIIAGSWVPLFVIFAIFSVRYAMGVGRGMELDIVQDRGVQMAVSLTLGGFSGFFLARGLGYWRAARQNSGRPHQLG